MPAVNIKKDINIKCPVLFIHAGLNNINTNAIVLMQLF